MWEKGTDRSLVTKGLKNKYSWVDNGSSFLPSDLLSAILFAQFESINYLQIERKKLFESYFSKFSQLVNLGLQTIVIPDNIQNNFHSFWVLFPSSKQRDLFIQKIYYKRYHAIYWIYSTS